MPMTATSQNADTKVIARNHRDAGILVLAKIDITDQECAALMAYIVLFSI
jgi:hypothetical protein